MSPPSPGAAGELAPVRKEHLQKQEPLRLTGVHLGVCWRQRREQDTLWKRAAEGSALTALLASETHEAKPAANHSKQTSYRLLWRLGGSSHTTDTFYFFLNDLKNGVPN